MVTTRVARAAGFSALSIIAALGFAAAVSTPTPAEAAVFVGFGFGFPIGYPFYYPPPAYYPPPPPYPAPASCPASGTPSQRSGGYAPSAPAESPRSPTRRGAAGRTRRVNIAENTGPLDLRATVRPSVTAPPAGTRAANGVS